MHQAEAHVGAWNIHAVATPYLPHDDDTGWCVAHTKKGYFILNVDTHECPLWQPSLEQAAEKWSEYVERDRAK